jgi:hypothetical protein
MPTNLRPNTETAKRDILRFAQSMVSNSVLKSLGLLLSPCCKATLAVSGWRCNWDGEVYGAVFQVSLSDTAFAGQTVTVVLQPLNYDSRGAGSIVRITFDAQGNWSGEIQTSIEGCTLPTNPFNLQFNVFVIPDGLNVHHTSNTVTTSINSTCC